MPHAARHESSLVEQTHPRLCRDVTIDALRGIAIFIIVAANLGPLLEAPHPFYYRLYSTFAAPVFILVAGMLVSRAFMLRLKDRGWRYYLERGAFLIAIGALLDMAAWDIAPFVTMDILYLMGFILPVAFALCHGPKWLPLLFALGVLVATPYLQNTAGYSSYPSEFGLSWFPSIYADGEALRAMLRQWLVDGWFPVFPWVGYMALGIPLARLRWPKGAVRRFVSRKCFLWSSSLTVLGTLCMVAQRGEPIVRGGYSALFYPPSPGVLMLTFGVTLLLFSLIDRTRGFVLWQLLRCLGESPLLMYILHIFIIGRVLQPVFGVLPASGFLILYGCFIVWLFCMGWALRLAKRGAPASPRPVRWLLGGLEA